MNKTIVFIDSGVGGLSTLSSLLKRNNYGIVYFADTQFAPYGSLTKKQIQSRICDIIFNLKTKFKPSLFVFACNTATTTSISRARQKFKTDLFIGTEPAIKLAKSLEFRHPLLIATPQTTSQIKHKNNIKCLSLKNFALTIENYLIKKSLFSQYQLLKQIFYIKRNIKNKDCLILGCTHYALIKPIIEKFIHIPIIDGNDGVAREIERKTLALGYGIQNKPVIHFIFSKDEAHLKENYKKILNQILANQINLC